MAVRNDCCITVTPSTDGDLIHALVEQDEAFFGESSTHQSMQEDSVADNTSEDEELNNDTDIDTLLKQAGGEEVDNLGGGSEEDSEQLISNSSDEIKCVQEEVKKGCGCSSDCYSLFTEDEIYSIRLEMAELEKPLKDMFLLGKLQVAANSTDSVSHARKTSKTKRSRVTFAYAYDNRNVCKSAFCFLHCIGTKALKNLQSHLKEHGPIPRAHGNLKRLPPNSFTYETVRNIVTFIIHFAELYGLPQPAAHRGRAATAPIYLAASEGYNTVHKKYVEACADGGLNAAKYHAFRNIWLKCVPHIRFMTPRTDVCYRCENFRVEIMRAITEEDKTRLVKEFQAHVEEAQSERRFYLSSIQKAETTDITEGRPHYSHYTFDFAQQLQIPYHARQVGPIFFKIPLKVQLFGICNDASKVQVNYLYDESQSIGINGTKSHGSNAVISMLHHFFEVHSVHAPVCHLHADNCVGQNKNRYVIGYLAWRVATGLHEEITLSFMRVGHTRCFVDGNFGFIKKCYRSADIDTVQQLPLLVERSSKTNTAQMFQWEWRDWQEMLGRLFIAVKGITKYQHVHLSSKAFGHVLTRTTCDSENETSVKILKRGITVRDVKEAELTSVISPPGLSFERKKYLFEQIRPHVLPEYRDITCPQP